MLIDLPRPLRKGMEAELNGMDSRLLEQRARRLSERYRAHEAKGRERFIEDADDARAYGALIVPASHAQLSGALRMIPRRVAEGFAPQSMLDIGSGPGTAIWAADAIWPELTKIVACEAEPAFIELSRRLLSHEGGRLHSAVKYRQGDVLKEGLPKGQFDLVVLGLILSELEPVERAKLVARAWAACQGVLLVVEPGTPATFGVVRHARDQLLSSGAQLLAPCPHAEACPMEESWCHFSERSERPDFQRRVKGASLPWEDARFSFVAVGREPSAGLPWARLLHQPKKTKGRMLLSACSAEGLVEPVVSKSQAAAYRMAKSLEWGSAIESAEELD